MFSNKKKKKNIIYIFKYTYKATMNEWLNLKNIRENSEENG